MRIFPLLLFCLLFPHLQGQNFTHLHLDLHFDPEAGTVTGTVEHRITDVQAEDSVFLNGPGIEILKMRWNKAVVPHSQVDSGVFVMPKAEQIDSVNSLSIAYRAQPRKGLYFIGWQDPTERARKQIWTQGQGIDHRHWIPHHDQQADKIIYSAVLHFDSAYQVISNGRLDSIQDQGAQWSWHYSMDSPMSSYLIAVAIGKYGYRESVGPDPVPRVQYFYPNRADDYQYYYRGNDKIYRFLLQDIGYPFPWQNYKQVPVRDFRHGAMENTTATIFGDFFLTDSLAYPDRNYTYVNAHELAHQWFGNLVTAPNSFHHWLHEGFATYYQWRSEAMLYGAERFAQDRFQAQQQVLAAEAQDSFPLAHPQAGSARFYQKGAWVLHMLRQKIGDQAFRKAVALYLERFAFKVAETDDLLGVLEEVSDQDLSSFFEQWVYRPGVLEVVIRTVEDRNQWELQLNNVSNKQAELLIGLHYQEQEGPDTIRLKLSPQTRQRQALPVKEGLRYWSCLNCPDLLGHYRFFKPLAFWQEQIDASEIFSNQMRAVEALASFTISDTRSTLMKYLLDDEAPALLRSKALQVLVTQSPNEVAAESCLDLALSGGSIALQKAVFEHWPDRPSASLRNKARKLAFEGGSYDLRARALNASFSPLADDHSWLYDSSFVKHPGLPAHQVHINALTLQVLSSGERSALWKLGDYCSPSFDFLTRIKALEVIAAFGAIDEEHVPHLFDALFNPNWKLRSKARLTLQNLATGPTRRYIHAYRLKMEDQWSDFQKRLVERTFEQVLD